MQFTLISLPYTVQRRSPIGTAAEHAGNALMQCGLLSILTIAILAVAAFGLGAHDARPEVVLTLILAAWRRSYCCGSSAVRSHSHTCT